MNDRVTMRDRFRKRPVPTPVKVVVVLVGFIAGVIVALFHPALA